MNNSLNILCYKKNYIPQRGVLEFYVHAIQTYLNNNSINLNGTCGVVKRGQSYNQLTIQTKISKKKKYINQKNYCLFCLYKVIYMRQYRLRIKKP